MYKKLLFLTSVVLVLGLAGSACGALKKGSYLLWPGTNTEMMVLWQLDSTMTCTLEWGQDTNYSTGSVQTSEHGTDHQHEYTISGLSPGTKYYYRVTAGAEQPTGSFWSAPPADATKIKFLAYGDTRTNPDKHDLVCEEMVDTFQADPNYQTFTLLTGDWVAVGERESDWTNQFFDPSYVNTHYMQANLPINGCIGNHEWDSGSIPPTLFDKYWPYPYVSGFYWSFDYGPVHVAVVDQYDEAYGAGSDQLTWLENDLAATTKEWKFIMLHEPGYSAGGGHDDEIDVQTYIQPLCETYGVDIVFAGHNHYYARCDANGIKHITTGGGGVSLDSADPHYSIYVETTTSAWHFCTIEIDGTTLNFEAREPNGSLVDSFSLYVEGTEPPTLYYPMMDAIGVLIDVNLAWVPGYSGFTAYHDVYLGTNETTVTNATDPNTPPGRGRQSLDANSYNPPGVLDFQTMYYWRIDEVNEPNIWTGDVWSFFTQEYTDVIDDMESYNGNKIYDTWENYGTGATVVLETTEVHGGQKSMNLTYDNSTSPYYSEIERRYKNPQKWLMHAPKALTLFFKGISDPPNAAEQMYVGLADTAHLDDPCVVTYDRPLSNLRLDDWQSWDIDLDDFPGVDLNDVNQIFIGFGDRDNPQAGGGGTMYFDDIRLYLSRCVPDRIPANFNGSSDCVVDSEDLDIMTDSWLIPANYSLTTVAPNSNNLVNWWKFDEGAFTTVSDSCSSNNGTLMIAPATPAWVPGMTGDPCDWALQFDGDNDGVELTSALTIFSSSFTVSAWIKVPYSATGRVGIILGDYGLWQAINVNLELYGDGEIRFYWDASPNLLGSTDLRDDSWHLVTFVRDKDAEKVYGYVDGNPDFEYSEAIDDKTATWPHRIGRDARTGDTAFDGVIDDVRIYNYALSHAEVGYLALQGGTPLAVPPLPPYAAKLDIVQDNKINLKDYAVLTEKWLVEQTWP